MNSTMTGMSFVAAALMATLTGAAERAPYAVTTEAVRMGDHIVVSVKITQTTTDGKTSVISAPRLLITQGQRGEIVVGTQQPDTPDKLESGFRVEVISVRGKDEVLVVSTIVEKGEVVWAQAVNAPAAPRATTAPATSKADQAVQKALDAKISKLDFDQTEFANVIRFLRDVSGTNIHVRWNDLARRHIAKSLPVTIRLKDVTVEQGLREVLKQAGTAEVPLTYRVEGDVITILAADEAARPSALLSPPAPPEGQVPDADRKVHKALQARISVEFEDVPLKDVFQFLYDVGGINISIPWRDLAKAGADRTMPVSLHLKQVTLDKALRVILGDLNSDPKDYLAYKVSEGKVVIAPVK